MDNAQVQSRDGVTLIGAGHPRPEDLDEALKLAPMLVAADGGADFALAMGHRPKAVIGDFDSLDPEVLQGFSGQERLHVTEQDTTDFEKCLTRIMAPFVIATGFTAGRIDHALAVYSVLARRIGPPTCLLGEEDVVIAAPRHLVLDLPPGSRFSLFPMSKITGRSEGLKWPIDGIDMSPSGQIGTSNEVTGPVALSFDAPGMLVILPRAALRAVLAALTG